MKRFQVGDEVEYISRSTCSTVLPTGLVGTVISVEKIGVEDWYGVRFPSFSHGHGLDGKVPYGQGWYCSECNLEYASPPIPDEDFASFLT